MKLFRKGIFIWLGLIMIVCQGCQPASSVPQATEASDVQEPVCSPDEAAENADRHYMRGGWHGEGQVVDIQMRRYLGDWVVGGWIGEGYVFDDVDPHGIVLGGILTLAEDKAEFAGPKGTVSVSNPTYRTVLESPYDFIIQRRSYYDSFGFHNDYIIRIDIMVGEDLWRPYGLGPLWIRDRDSLIALHHCYHVLTRPAQ